MWTDDIIELAKVLWKRGLTLTEIGEVVGKTRNAVCGKLNREGLIGDGSHHPGLSQHTIRKVKEARKSKVAPPAAKPSRSRAREAELATPLAAPPPAELAEFCSIAGWQGIVAAVEVLQNGKCRYPLPEGPVAPTGFCMAPCGPRDVYCGYHAQIAYRPPGSLPEPFNDSAPTKKFWKF